MNESRLILHRSAREVPRDVLAAVATPAPSRRWVPVSHDHAVATVTETLRSCGFDVRRERYALSADDGRLFGVLDVGVEIAPDVSLAVGLRNSIDQTFPLGFCAGHRVFVCDNLAFSAELMVRRKHTRFGADRFREDIGQCVAKLEEFRVAEEARIVRMRNTPVSDERAESLLLRSVYERRIINHRQILPVLKEWREPRHEAFAERTMWSLFNAFTLALGDRAQSNPQAHAGATMRLQALLNPERN